MGETSGGAALADRADILSPRNKAGGMGYLWTEEVEHSETQARRSGDEDEVTSLLCFADANAIAGKVRAIRPLDFARCRASESPPSERFVNSCRTPSPRTRYTQDCPKGIAYLSTCASYPTRRLASHNTLTRVIAIEFIRGRSLAIGWDKGLRIHGPATRNQSGGGKVLSIGSTTLVTRRTHDCCPGSRCQSPAFPHDRTTWTSVQMLYIAWLQAGMRCSVKGCEPWAAVDAPHKALPQPQRMFTKLGRLTRMETDCSRMNPVLAAEAAGPS